MPLGDSITAGGGSSTGGGYRLPLWERLSEHPEQPIDFVGSARAGSFADPDHEGHSGYVIDGLRAHIDDWVAAAQPDIVLLHAGINDVDFGRRQGAPERLIELADRIAADRPNSVVYVLGLIPTTDGLEDQAVTFNASVRSASAAHGYLWVEPPALSADELPDGLHPNDKGYVRMAEALYRALQGQVEASPLPGDGCLPSP
ncbi:SGNH/GDSL hydrolase family protein [Streptomyces goshikiensis]|uniref:SGNH/GDSL hydrolase family protein n=1 Tax=Streptomyces goshikiensis TaxID=1942 RepID=UPI002E105069|nr:SGNH/GDSL hydrolase family protein [Streptomyces goshikiensis]